LKEIKDEDRAKLDWAGRRRRRRMEKSWSYRRLLDALDKDSELRDLPARFRALKRLAIQGHDTERELEFHARELQAQRFTEDWPVPFRLFKGKRWLPIAFLHVRAWAGFFRFLFGILYAFFSDYGRSLARPLITAVVMALAAAVFFLGQTDAVQRALGPENATYLQTARYAYSNPVPCYSPPPTAFEIWRARWPWLRRDAKAPPAPPSSTSRIDGLIEPFRSQTGARAEALFLAFRNALVVLDGSGEAAHRSYGCLYGVELYGGSTPVAVVPSAISLASGIQKVLSAVMIFLFGLALRNMLKMK
jgi:hypothetical protein